MVGVIRKSKLQVVRTRTVTKKFFKTKKRLLVSVQLVQILELTVTVIIILIIYIYRRLRWLGHLSRMECHRIPRQAHHWEPDGFRKRPGRPRQNWRGVISKDLKKTGIGWDEVQEATEDRRSWWICVAQ